MSPVNVSIKPATKMKKLQKESRNGEKDKWWERWLNSRRQESSLKRKQMFKHRMAKKSNPQAIHMVVSTHKGRGGGEGLKTIPPRPTSTHPTYSLCSCCGVHPVAFCHVLKPFWWLAWLIALRNILQHFMILTTVNKNKGNGKEI